MGEKEDILVLWAVGELNRREIGRREKRNFLEVLNDRLQGELESLFEGVAEQLTRFRVRVEKLVGMSEEEIEDHLNSKYGQVVNR